MRGFWIKCPELKENKINEKNMMKKKIFVDAEPEMGYCPLGIRQARSLGAAQGMRANVRGTEAKRWARGTGVRRGRAVGPAGCALGALSLF